MFYTEQIFDRPDLKHPVALYLSYEFDELKKVGQIFTGLKTTNIDGRQIESRCCTADNLEEGLVNIELFTELAREIFTTPELIGPSLTTAAIHLQLLTLEQILELSKGLYEVTVS